MEKRIMMIVFLIILVINAFADYRITRGPDVGEIYFIGPTATGEGIYHSTDFGETATCMDSVNQVESISADLTSGGLYKIQMPDALFYSDSYGHEDSWIFRTAEGSHTIYGGRSEGEIFKGVSMRSIDYGFNFSNNQCLGLFGFPIIPEIDNQEECGYTIVNQYGISDTLWLLITYDNFETLEIQNVFNYYEFPISDLSRGTEYGELYNFVDSPCKISHSIDYGLSWEYINEFNSGLDYTDFVGGRQAGEVYILVTYTALMHTIDHSYIFHSTDYGRTFDVFHTFAKGDEPLVANFSSSVTESVLPFTVQFSNYSVGEIFSYEWDFDNDGIIDSNEPEPEYTYQDTGYYSVKLIIHDDDGTDEFLREDFIHVTGVSGIEDNKLEAFNYNLSNYPNPFNPSTEIRFQIPDYRQNEDIKIDIYNLKGQLIRELKIQNSKFKINSVIWNGKDSNGKLVSSGIYYYKLNLGSNVEFPIKKMILIK